MNDFTNESLGREQLTSEELREVLSRLGNKQFGGPDNTDLGAVAEATSVPVHEVGRILAEVRREHMERTLGHRIEAQELDLQRLELAVRSLEHAQNVAHSQAGPPISRSARDINRFVQGMVVLAILVVIMLAMFVVIGPSRVETVPGAPTAPTPSVSTSPDGVAPTAPSP